MCDVQLMIKPHAAPLLDYVETVPSPFLNSTSKILVIFAICKVLVFLQTFYFFFPMPEMNANLNILAFSPLLNSRLKELFSTCLFISCHVAAVVRSHKVECDWLGGCYLP